MIPKHYITWIAAVQGEGVHFVHEAGNKTPAFLFHNELVKLSSFFAGEFSQFAFRQVSKHNM